VNRLQLLDLGAQGLVFSHQGFEENFQLAGLVARGLHLDRLAADQGLEPPDFGDQGVALSDLRRLALFQLLLEVVQNFDVYSHVRLALWPRLGQIVYNVS